MTRNITIFLAFLALLQLLSARHLTDYTKPIRCPFLQCCCCSHFVYALDESGSMRGSRWNTLVSTMAAVPGQIGNNGRKHYMTTYEFSGEAKNPNFFHRPPSQFFTGILGHDSGGTDFNSALTKAISIISGYMSENTCFFMITDGLSNFSTVTANLFDSILERIRRNGCRACAYCYFIKSFPNTKIPTQFQRLCIQIGASIRNVLVSQFVDQFAADQRAAVAQFVR